MPFRPIYPFNAVKDDGTSYVIGPDQIFADDHPFVRKYPTLFVDIADVVIEAATAGPGEKRSTRRG